MISLLAHVLLFYMLVGWAVGVSFLVAMDRSDLGAHWWQTAWVAPLRDLVLTLAVGGLLAIAWPFIAWAWWRAAKD